MQVLFRKLANNEEPSKSDIQDLVIALNPRVMPANPEGEEITEVAKEKETKRLALVILAVLPQKFKEIIDKETITCVKALLQNSAHTVGSSPAKGGSPKLISELTTQALSEQDYAHANKLNQHYQAISFSQQFDLLNAMTVIKRHKREHASLRQNLDLVMDNILKSLRQKALLLPEQKKEYLLQYSSTYEELLKKEGYLQSLSGKRSRG